MALNTMALNTSWKAKLTNQRLYGELPPVSSKVAHRRMLIAGHCVRHEEEASKLVLWQPLQGQRKRGRRTLSYIDTLMEDAGLDNINELDREGWSIEASGSST